MKTVGATVRQLAVLALAWHLPIGAAECVLAQGRLQAGGVCLAIKVIAAPATPHRPLAVIVHGDGGGFIEPGYLRRLETTARRIAEARPSDGVVVLQRPGYRSSLGRSEGRAKREDDDYTEENVAHLANGLRALRDQWLPSRLIWVGHSGGAALGALVMGREKGLIQAAVLAACPCGDIRQWRTHRNQSRGRPAESTWPNSLSPVDHLEGLTPDLRVTMLTGDRDENTLARFNVPWIQRAGARGVRVKSLILQGISHGQAADAPEVALEAALFMDATP